MHTYWRYLAGSAALFVAAGFTFTPAVSAADPTGWKLVWEDDFDELDTERWTVMTSDNPTNNSLHAYLPEQVRVENGQLLIESSNEPHGDLKYRSGQIISKSEQKHGRWEVRAKLPTTAGMWPAIWLLPDVERWPWPTAGEIDIMESRGSEPTVTSSAFHYGTVEPYNHEFVFHQQQTRIGPGFVHYPHDFHTYAVEWTEDRLYFFVDDVLYYTVYDEDIGGFLAQYTQPMRLVINNAIGGDFLPNPNATTKWPQTMAIDWVRVYEQVGPPNSRELVNTSFENGLSGWSVFGNDLLSDPNVSAETEAVADGDYSLKLFGAFAWGSDYSGVTQALAVSPGEQVDASLKAYVRSDDSLKDRGNEVTFKIEFYSVPRGRFGSDSMIEIEEIVIADKSVEEDVWKDHAISAVAPEGAVEARIVVVFAQPEYDPGAIHIDSIQASITEAGPEEEPDTSS